MSTTAEKTDPKLWDKVKTKVTKGDKGGKPGQWSARKAQLAVHDYKAEGGGYKGNKIGGQPSCPVDARGVGHEVGRRQRRDRRALPAEEDPRDADRQANMRAPRRKAGGHGQGQAVLRPARRRGRKDRRGPAEDMTLAELRQRAAAHGIAGRSKMSKAELVKALAG